MKKFVIFGLGRSGTTSLSASLSFPDTDNLIQEPLMLESGDRHKIADITSKYEIRPEQNTVDLDEFPITETSYRFLDEIYERYDGFKHIYSSTQPLLNLNLVSYFREHDIRVLFLRRRSLLNAAISNHLKRVQSQKDSPCADEKKLKATMQWFYTCTACANLMLSENIQEKNLLTFHYEDLYCQDIEARKTNFNTICEFFEIDQKKLNSKVVEARFLFPHQEYTNKIYDHLPNYHKLQEKYKTLNG